MTAGAPGRFERAAPRSPTFIPMRSQKKPETLDHGRVGFSVRWHANGVIRTEAGFMAGCEFAPRAIRVTIDGGPSQ